MKKTNALRLLDASNIQYETVTYPIDENNLSGKHVLSAVPLPSGAVFKTLVLKGERQGLLVVCIPVLEEIDLKKLALAIKDKKVEMLPLKQLLSTTGYVRGGCSPLGMKKRLPTYFDSSCLAYEKLSVSAGVRGMQMLVKREDLLQITKASCIDVIKIDK